MISRKTMIRGLITTAVVCIAQAARAYVDLAPTLPRIITDSNTIAIVEVTSYDFQKHVVTFKPVQVLKGALADTSMAHEVAPIGGVPTCQIVQWAVPGSRAVIFQSRTAARGSTLVCIGEGWYQVNAIGSGAWRLGQERPDLPLAYYGSYQRLTEAVECLLKGEAAVITAVAYGNDSAAAAFDLALNRMALPGVVKVQRMRTTPTMTGNTMGSASAFIGLGIVDECDLPDLLKDLKSPDLAARTEAVENLRTLDRKAQEAAPALAFMLTDGNPRLRFAAASALLRLTSKDAGGVPVLRAGMNDKDPVVRRYAASAAGYCGSAGEPLCVGLTALLSDPVESVRLTALQAVSTLGPTAANAAPVLMQMLENKELANDAADALGRIGPAAAPALKKLASMLSSPQLTTRWAAVRAMAQIGGPEAHPAVEFMVKAMNGATEVEGYNMMIYFGMLGPVAKDALPAIQNFVIKNPMVCNAAQWAIKQDRFPWDYAGAPYSGNPIAGGRSNMGGFGGALNELHLAAFVKELGPRLGSLSPVLAKALMEKKAGEVPIWGYDLLRAAPGEALAVLTPNLRSEQLALRERAAAAIGYMGEEGLAAKGAVEEALAKAATQREKNLLLWTLRKMDGE
jgi:HEAT repeat protein